MRHFSPPPCIVSPKCKTISWARIGLNCMWLRWIHHENSIISWYCFSVMHNHRTWFHVSAEKTKEISLSKYWAWEGKKARNFGETVHMHKWNPISGSAKLNIKCSLARILALEFFTNVSDACISAKFLAKTAILKCFECTICRCWPNSFLTLSKHLCGHWNAVVQF